MGKATILFHCILVVMQIILLRKNFEIKNLLQVVVGIIFGYFTTFCNWSVAFLHTPESFAIRLLMMLVSTVFIAFGIFLYMPANIMPLAGEGAMKAITQVTDIDFSKVKVVFDITMVGVSLVVCFAMLENIGSVGIGTIIAAILVGTVHGFITKILGEKRDIFLEN